MATEFNDKNSDDQSQKTVTGDELQRVTGDTPLTPEKVSPDCQGDSEPDWLTIKEVLIRYAWRSRHNVYKLIDKGEWQQKVDATGKTLVGIPKGWTRNNKKWQHLEAAPPPCSDAGNAIRLLNRFRNEVRRVGGSWYHYSGRYWQRDIDGCGIMHRAKQLASLVQQEALEQENETHAENLQKWAFTCGQFNRLDRAVKLLSTEPEIQSSIEDFDTDPYLLNIQNGKIDLATGRFTAGHKPSDLCTRMGAWSYDARATCPRWLEYLRHAVPDEKEREWIRRVMWYCLTGRRDIEEFYLATGVSGSGKSTIGIALRHLAGSYFGTVPASTLMASKVSTPGAPRADLAKLPGCRILVPLEVPAGEKWDDALIASLIGGDEVPARFPHAKEDIRFVPILKLYIHGNYRPQGVAHSGLWRRMCELNFAQKLPHFAWGGSDFKGYLWTNELKGIANWVLEVGPDVIRDGGTNPPQSVIDRRRDYRERMDLIEQFLSDRVKKGYPDADQNESTTLEQVHAAFNQWLSKKAPSNRLWAETTVRSEIEKRYKVERVDGVMKVLGVKL